MPASSSTHPDNKPGWKNQDGKPVAPLLVEIDLHLLDELENAVDEIDMHGEIDDPLISMQYAKLWLAVKALVAVRP